MSETRRFGHRPVLLGAALSIVSAVCGVGGSLAQDALPNACPVDGCEVRIVDAKKSGDELALTFEANYTPDLSKNHIHVWWGDNFTVKQVSNNAETVHGVKQGDWHPTDEYPSYITQGPVSMATRGDSKTICVSAGDRNHDIIDVTKFHCMDISKLVSP
jgi:hypothetical protein